jgi:hypothetical protein
LPGQRGIEPGDDDCLNKEHERGSRRWMQQQERPQNPYTLRAKEEMVSQNKAKDQAEG